MGLLGLYVGIKTAQIVHKEIRGENKMGGFLKKGKKFNKKKVKLPEYKFPKGFKKKKRLI